VYLYNALSGVVNVFLANVTIFMKNKLKQADTDYVISDEIKEVETADADENSDEIKEVETADADEQTKDENSDHTDPKGWQNLRAKVKALELEKKLALKENEDWKKKSAENLTLEEEVAQLKAEMENSKLEKETLLKQNSAVEKLTESGLNPTKLNFVKKYLLNSLVASDDLDFEIENIKQDNPELFKQPANSAIAPVPSRSTIVGRLTQEKAMQILNSKNVQTEYSTKELFNALNSN